jgi:hypothetical protein
MKVIVNKVLALNLIIPLKIKCINRALVNHIKINFIQKNVFLIFKVATIRKIMKSFSLRRENLFMKIELDKVIIQAPNM